MTGDEMLDILEALAHGADPETGEALPETSPYNAPHVVRALFLAIRELEAMRETKAKAQRREPARANEAWSAKEERELADAFDQGSAIAELATRHQRTPRAIEARLIRIGKLPPKELTPSTS